MKKPERGWFVTGTDTDVGKTFVACRMLERLRAQGVRVGAYKPVASGARRDEESDAHALWVAIGQRVPRNLVKPQSFAVPLAPPVAAELENRSVDERLLIAGIEAWCDECDCLLVEGAGGLLSPITWTMTNADLARAVGYPLVVVARNRLGVAHQVLATLVAAQAYGLSVAEIVLNDVDPAGSDTRAMETNERLLRPFLHRDWPDVPIRRELHRAVGE